MYPVTLALLLAAASALSAQQHPLERLVGAVREDPSAPATTQLINETLGPRGGTAVWGQDFLFVSASATPLYLSIDGMAPLPMQRVELTNLWMRVEKLRTGVTHSYQYATEGKLIGSRADVAGYQADSYPKPGVPRGTLSDKRTIVSKLYDGMTADYWVYLSPGVKPGVEAPLMVWQDGQGLIAGDLSRLRLFTVTENLIAQRLLPPLVHVLIAPGTSPDGKAMRSVEYDTLGDKYARFLMEEVLPEVEKFQPLRQDGYSRAIGGESSGGICSFNVAWYQPAKFARVHSTIGSYTSIQWRPEDKLDGGNVYPNMVRKQPKRNIRVWMSDGADDIENDFGSWPLQNIQLANSLKLKGYDYHFRFGHAAHNSSQAALDLPESLTWLWRGYDPAKTSEEFTQDASEHDQPLYRVTISNRDAW